MTRPFYRFKGRKPGPVDHYTGIPMSDRLTWYDEHNPAQTVETSEWAYWRLWRFFPGNKAHPLYEGSVD